MKVAEVDTIVADMTAKHTAAIARQNALADERNTIAFYAHTGDAKARIRLDEINQSDAVLVGEISSLVAAVDEAKRRQIEARRLASIDVQQDRARQVQKRLVGVRKHGAELDKLAASFVSKVAEFRSEISDLRKLGLDRPDIVTIDANFRRALESVLMATPLQTSHVTPSQRTTFAALVEAWARTIEGWCDQQLADAKPSQAAA